MNVNKIIQEGISLLIKRDILCEDVITRICVPVIVESNGIISIWICPGLSFKIVGDKIDRYTTEERYDLSSIDIKSIKEFIRLRAESAEDKKKNDSNWMLGFKVTNRTRSEKRVSEVMKLSQYLEQNKHDPANQQLRVSQTTSNDKGGLGAFARRIRDANICWLCYLCWQGC